MGTGAKHVRPSASGLTLPGGFYDPLLHSVDLGRAPVRAFLLYLGQCSVRSDFSPTGGSVMPEDQGGAAGMRRAGPGVPANTLGSTGQPPEQRTALPAMSL